MKKFEYKTFQIKLNDIQLTSLGLEGWELISHTAVTDGRNNAQYYIFKREIND